MLLQFVAKLIHQTWHEDIESSGFPVALLEASWSGHPCDRHWSAMNSFRTCPKIELSRSLLRPFEIMDCSVQLILKESDPEWQLCQWDTHSISVAQQHWVCVSRLKSWCLRIMGKVTSASHSKYVGHWTLTGAHCQRIRGKKCTGITFDIFMFFICL